MKSAEAKSDVLPKAASSEFLPKSSPQAVAPPASSRRMPEIRYPSTGYSMPNIEGPIPPLPDEYRASPSTLLPIPPPR